MNVQDVTSILNVSNLQERFAWFEQLGSKKHWEHEDPPNFGAVISENSEIFVCQGGQGARGGPSRATPGTIPLHPTAAVPAHGERVRAWRLNDRCVARWFC